MMEWVLDEMSLGKPSSMTSPDISILQEWGGGEIAAIPLEQ
jgi:hypothetical protein